MEQYNWNVVLMLWLLSSQGGEEEEAETFEVTLTKNTQGLGITIAGYVGDKNSGRTIFYEII